MQNEIKLTEAERKLIENFDSGVRGKHFGQLQCKKYLGKNQELQFLNLLKIEENQKYIGAIHSVKGEDAWYFQGIDGEKYRIPEPVDGIDSLFDIEFKRRDL